MNAPSDHDNTGQSLLSDMEAQELTDFFSQTPWNDVAYPTATGSKDGADAFSWPFGPPPATIHSVSTTIPDQAQLHGFQLDHNLVSPHTPHFASTADDLQAASTLFNHAHMPPPAARSHSFHALPSSSAPTNGQLPNAFTSLPMVPTANGLIHEQLAALLPNHHNEGSIDASLAAHWAHSPLQHQHGLHLRELGLQRPPLKRPYTYGSDSNFHESGFQVSSKQETEDFVIGRLMHDLQHAQPMARKPSTGAELKSPRSPRAHASVAAENEPSSNDDDESDEDSDHRAPKRRKSKAARARSGKATSGARKSATTSKNRKASVDDRAIKKKRGSVAGQKAQRENLSEEQKRSNHILSEQKRRNLIKRGFDDLHDLVPAIRNGGLSKSGILTEAANFLEKLIADNTHYEELLRAAAG